MTKTRIAVLTPCYNGKRDPKTEKCLLECKKYFSNFEFISFTSNEVYIHRGRTMLMKEVLDYNKTKKIEFVLWLDSDVYFEPKQLSKLIQDVSKPEIHCVSGVYFNRHANHHPMFCNINNRGQVKWDFLNAIPNKIFPVDGIGFGFFLMNMNILEFYSRKYKMEDWFDSSKWYPRNNDNEPLFTIGEDLDFCAKLKKIDYRTFIDGSVLLSHKGITVKDYGKWKKENTWHPHCTAQVKVI